MECLKGEGVALGVGGGGGRLRWLIKKCINQILVFYKTMLSTEMTQWKLKIIINWSAY